MIKAAEPTKNVARDNRTLLVDGVVAFSQDKGESRGSFSGSFARLSLPQWSDRSSRPTAAQAGEKLFKLGSK